MPHDTINPTCAYDWALTIACDGQVSKASEALAMMRISGYSLDASMLAVRALVSAGLVA